MFFRRLFKNIQVTYEVCGLNQNSQLGEKSNKMSIGDIPIISPLVKSRQDVSSFLSYSIYTDHAVFISKSGVIEAIGDNTEGQISGSLPKEILREFTQFEIKDSNDVTWIPISVVCGYSYTLYLLTNPEILGKTKLAYSYKGTQDPYPTFLNIKHAIPVSLYGGYSNAAAIDTDGSIIFVPESTSTYPESLIESIGLPDGEKAISVACCDTFIIVLSSNGHVYRSSSSGTSDLTLIEDISPHNSEIVHISGTRNHCFATDRNGTVFALGSNSNGRLGIGENVKQTDEFLPVQPLENYKIKEAYAGNNHSLFLTTDGKVLACGSNNYGQIPASGILTSVDKVYYTPVETLVSSGASFCIAGGLVSIFFSNCIPEKMPNKTITKGEIEGGIEQEAHSHTKSTDDINDSVDENTLLRQKVEQLQNENLSLRKKIFDLQLNGNNESSENLNREDIDQLKQVKLIGNGLKSTVFEVSRDQRFALKAIQSPQNLPQILDEFQKLNGLHHPNLVQSFGIFNGGDDKDPSILIELCSSNLKETVKDFTKVEKVTSIYEIALALKELHSKSFIHKDLKPENILVDEQKHAKVDIFNVSRFVDLEEQKSQMKEDDETIKFVAPEILNNGDNMNEKVDVYSFGIIVYFILTGGQCPDLSPEQQPVLDGINDLAKELITSCLSTNIDDRPSFESIAEKIKTNDFGLVDGIENDINQIKSFLLI